MAQATSKTKDKDLYCESKTRLGERIAGNVSSCASIARQVIRGSKSSDMLSQCARNFASHEYFIDNTENNLKKMSAVSSQMNVQPEKVFAVNEQTDGCLR